MLRTHHVSQDLELCEIVWISADRWILLCVRQKDNIY